MAGRKGGHTGHSVLFFESEKRSVKYVQSFRGLACIWDCIQSSARARTAAAAKERKKGRKAGRKCR